MNKAATTAAIIPAFNEADRIVPVLTAVKAAELVDDVLVVSDGSTDATAQIAQSVQGVRVQQFTRNLGKAAAMRAGALASQADVVVFIDADLAGLTGQHVDALLLPVINGEAEMCVGVFRGGRFWTDLAQKIAPVISGQRAIRRDSFLSIPALETVRMGVEVALTKWARLNSVCVCTVEIAGVTHAMKEEKLGPIRGFGARLAMYWDIGRVLLDGRKLAAPPPRLHEKKTLR